MLTKLDFLPGSAQVKGSIFAFLIFLAAGNIFALDFSAGGGALTGYTFSRYTLEADNAESKQTMDRFNYGGFLFFDAVFVQLSVMIIGGNSAYSENMTHDNSPLPGGEGRGSELNLGFSLMGKFPFSLNEKISVFPMLGAEYQIALIQRRQPDGDFVYDRAKGELAEDRDKNDDPYPLYAWNSWWINIGAGLDYFITDSFFLRGESIFGFRLPTKYEMGALEKLEYLMNITNPKLKGLTGSPIIKISAGYRF